jgi:hypothetical protein
MKNWAKKHILLSKIRVKRRKKDRFRPLTDKKGHFKFRPSFKGNIQKKGRRNTTAYGLPGGWPRIGILFSVRQTLSAVRCARPGWAGSPWAAGVHAAEITKFEHVSSDPQLTNINTFNSRVSEDNFLCC